MKQFVVRIIPLIAANVLVSQTIFSGEPTGWLYAVPVLGSLHGILFAKRGERWLS